MEMTESVIKQMRWRAFFYFKNESNEGDEHDDEQCYGLKSLKCPPKVEELKPFENDMMKLIKGVTFRRRTQDNFQKILNKDMAQI